MRSSGGSRVDGPGLSATMKALAGLGSWVAISALLWGLFLALLMLRRLRHLLVVLIAWTLQGLIIQYLLGPLLRRPRPFGVEFRTDWYAWALPSEQMAALAVTLVGILYALVPEGRWRQTGKWTAAAVVALVAVARMHLGVEAPSDVVVGVVIGVTIPLLGLPVHPGRGLPRDLPARASRPLGRRRCTWEAIRRALEDQLGLVVEDVEPFGLAGSAGSTPLRIKINDGPNTWLFGKLYARGHLRADRWNKLGRELLYGRLEDEKPFHTVRRLVQQEDYACGTSCTSPGCPHRVPTASWSSLPSGNTCWSPSSSTMRPSSARPRSTTASSTTDWRSSASCGTPGWPTATSSRPTCWSATATCC